MSSDPPRTALFVCLLKDVSYSSLFILHSSVRWLLTHDWIGLLGNVAHYRLWKTILNSHCFFFLFSFVVWNAWHPLEQSFAPGVDFWLICIFRNVSVIWNWVFHPLGTKSESSGFTSSLYVREATLSCPVSANILPFFLSHGPCTQDSLYVWSCAMGSGRGFHFDRQGDFMQIRSIWCAVPPLEPPEKL